jgi:hypothetical protein
MLNFAFLFCVLLVQSDSPVDVSVSSTSETAFDAVDTKGSCSFGGFQFNQLKNGPDLLWSGSPIGTFSLHVDRKSDETTTHTDFSTSE